MADLWSPVNGVYTAAAPLFPWVESLLGIDIGGWPSALISAGFGAGIGAWMAGRIARNGKLTPLAEYDLGRSLANSASASAAEVNRGVFSYLVYALLGGGRLLRLT